MEEVKEESQFKEHESGLKYREYEVEGETLRVFMSDDHARLEFEEYEEYRFRRQVNKYLNKQARKGRQFWMSNLPVNNKGVRGNTYNKERANKIKQQLIDKQNGESNGK